MSVPSRNFHEGCPKRFGGKRKNTYTPLMLSASIIGLSAGRSGRDQSRMGRRAGVRQVP